MSDELQRILDDARAQKAALGADANQDYDLILADRGDADWLQSVGGIKGIPVVVAPEDRVQAVGLALCWEGVRTYPLSMARLGYSLAYQREQRFMDAFFGDAPRPIIAEKRA
jgi:hypothetical protein